MDALTKIALIASEGWSAERERSARLERMLNDRMQFKSVDQQRQVEESFKQREALVVKADRLTEALSLISGLPSVIGNPAALLREAARVADEALKVTST